MRIWYRSLLKTNFIIFHARSDRKRQFSFNNDTRPAIRPAMPESMLGRCAIIGLKSNEFRKLGNPSSLTESTRRAPLCGSVPLYLSRPNGRLAQLTDSDILISPGY